jgi:hypothetical protein
VSWIYVQIRFTGKPPARRQLPRINKLVGSLDLGAPPVTEGGVDDGWQGPRLSVAELASVLHAWGLPCEYRSVDWDWSEEDQDETRERLSASPWRASAPDLSWARGEEHQLVRQRLLGFSRRFWRWL